MGMDFLLAIISSMLIGNVILTRFLGICPFIGVSKKLPSAIGMGFATLFVLLVSSMVIWPIYNFILIPAGLGFLDIVVFILVIASIVQIVELVIKKVSTPLYKSLGVYLPLIATNCAIIGVILASGAESKTFGETMADAIGTGLGFLMVMVIFSAIRVRLENANLPKSFKGVPIALVVTAIMALAFFGFAGMI